jgi:predicted nucleic acid-binding protein
MAVMVDSCVYLDVFSRDSSWYSWSANALADAASSGDIVLNPIIYAEISVQFERIEELEVELPEDIFQLHEIPREAAFLAGKCFVKYRRKGGLKQSPLPDFFIGAHALIANFQLVTRDPRRFRQYFPKVRLICP